MGFLKRIFGGKDAPPLPSVTVTANAPEERPRRSSSSVRADSVVPATLDPAWPVVPPGDSTVRLTAAERQALPYDRTTCPSCGAEVSPLPKRKTGCKTCGAAMYVRVVADDHRSLMTEGEATTFDRVTGEREQREGEEAELAWYAQLLANGVQICDDPLGDGGETLEVVGESHHHADLAALMAALRDGPTDREAMTVALLRREPTNQYDKLAVRVEIHGKLVGYIGRDEANEIQSWLRGLEKAGTPAYVLARIGGGRVEQGRVGPIGVTIEDFPDVFDGGT